MDTERALDGIRVIDLTQVMAGPYCCMLLGDMGADVIKVEPPGGEASRHVAFEIAPGISGPFLAVNRNKRGLTLDLKRPEAVAVLTRLIGTADVLVENYRPGVARRLGIDYEALRQINPRLVYCSISGFGQTGPYAGRRTFVCGAQIWPRTPLTRVRLACSLRAPPRSWTLLIALAGFLRQAP